MDLSGALARIERFHLGAFPTPVERLHKLEEKIGRGPVYIKRDDLTGLGPGGNKTRSLEFIMGEALAQGCDVIIASGPLQSNLCTLAACAAGKAGLDCILVHNGAEPGRYTGNLLLNRLLGVECRFIGDVSSAERTMYVQSLHKELTMKSRKPYIIQNGASTGLGALGYVRFVDELLTQVKEQALDMRNIFVPAGNGGVAAGLIYGNALANMPFRVQVISVEHPTSELTELIGGILSEIEQRTGIPMKHALESVCSITDDYRGEGWGLNTPESEACVLSFPRLQGIFLENVYTAKALWGMTDMLRKNKAEGGSCLLHTGGFGSLFDQYERGGG